MKQNNTGYRELLRDRCPRVVSQALKWCKAKELWLDYVYKEQIWPISSKKERLNQTKLILGIGTDGKQHFDFHSTIEWKSLKPEDVYDWAYVESWVNFFVKKYAYIENTYIISKTYGKTIEEIKLEIMKSHLMEFCPRTDDNEQTKIEKSQYVNDLTDFLIDCFDGKIQ